jgi:hypothetical protein
MIPEYTDQRQSPRVSVDLDAEIQQEDKVFRGKVLNCSLSGIFLRTDEKLADGERVEVRIFLPGIDTPIVAASRVIWTDWNDLKERPGFGMHFLTLSDDQALLLRAFLYD